MRSIPGYEEGDHFQVNLAAFRAVESGALYVVYLLPAAKFWFRSNRRSPNSRCGTRARWPDNRRYNLWNRVRAPFRRKPPGTNKHRHP